MGVTVNQWAAKGACRSSDPDALFVQGAAQNRAKAVCLSCPVRTECLSDALDHKIEFGVWGGMTERERRGLVRGGAQRAARGRLRGAGGRCCGGGPTCSPGVGCWRRLEPSRSA